jgi:amidohydrolase
MISFLPEAEDLFEYTRQLRRDFHRHPELGFQEFRTAGIVARELTALGLEVSTGIAETGVVALLEGKQDGPVVLLRFDMDALPIDEETGAEYASQNPGVMHACGHDGHTAIGLTVARLLYERQEALSGTVKFVFQPAEEGLGGAAKMIAEGVLEGPRPDIALALHIWNDKPLGWLGITPGPVMAAADTFDIALTGKGGHGASPHQTKDPLVAAAQIVSAVQNIVSRNVNPLDSAVISVTAMNAGDAFNVIPSAVRLKGTIRTFEADIRTLVHERFRQIVGGIAEAFDCPVDIHLEKVTPAVANNFEVTGKVQNIAREVFPNKSMVTDYRTMGSEDMAYLMEDVPGCYFFIGSSDREKGLDAAHHNPRFDFDERVMPAAAGLMASIAAHLLNS